MSNLKELEQHTALVLAEHLQDEVPSTAIWEEEPVTFREFCESPAYLGIFALSDRQYSDVEHLVGTDPKMTLNPNREVDILVLVYGKGGGKDEVAARVGLYVVYLLLCLVNPQEYLLGVNSTSEFHLLNVAKKSRQAEGIFFTYLTRMVKGSRWFKDRFDIQHEGKWFSRTRSRSRGTVTLTKSGADFPKGVRCLAETTENESWEGYNIAYYCLDEISGFTSTAELETAWKMYHTARTSCTSRGTGNYRGLGMVISYPRQEEGDVILDLMKIAQTSDRMYASLAYPWISKGSKIYSGNTFIFRHPRLDSFFGVENVGVEVPVELKGDFDDNAEDSLTKYLCIPPKTVGGWIEYPDQVMAQVCSLDPTNPRFRPRLFKTYDYIDDAVDGEGHNIRYLSKKIVSCSAKTQYDKYTVPRVAWLDAAQKHCDAVIVIAHLEIRTINTDQGPMPVEVVVIDDEILWRPNADKGIQVSIINLDFWLTDILPSQINLVAVGSDHWNSAEVEERLRKRGIKTEIHDLNRGDYDILKKQLYVGGMDLIPGEFSHQIVNLINGNPKQKPIKKPGFRQDVADGVCGAVRLLVGLDKHKRPTMSRRMTQGRPVGISGGGFSIPNPMAQVGTPPAAAMNRLMTAPNSGDLGGNDNHSASPLIRNIPVQGGEFRSPDLVRRSFPSPTKL